MPDKSEETESFLGHHKKVKAEFQKNSGKISLTDLKNLRCSAACWGRVARKIACLLTLYVILFLLLTALIIFVLQFVVSEDSPYLTGGQSLLNLSPGLSYRPNVNFLTSLIAYRAADPQSFMPYVQNIRTFMYFYEEVNIRPQDSFASCEENMKTPDVPDLVCKFFPMVLGPCVKENNYGYDRNEPCVILKINRIYGWVPDIVNKTMGQNPLLTCQGMNSLGNEGFGRIRYFPNVTIDGKVYGYFNNLYFPYIIQFAYRSPLVAVQFVNITRHSLFMISCSLLNVRQTAGPVNFELLID